LSEGEKIKTISKNESKEIFISILVPGIIDIGLIYYVLSDRLDNLILQIFFFILSITSLIFALKGLITEKFKLKSLLVEKAITPKLYWIIFYDYLIMFILLTSLVIKSAII